MLLKCIELGRIIFCICLKHLLKLKNGNILIWLL